MRNGMVCGGLPFLGADCPVPDVGNIFLRWNGYYANVGNTVSALIHFPRKFLSKEYRFETDKLDKSPRAPFI